MESSSVFDRLTPQNIDLRDPVTGFSVFAARKMEREPKNERGGRGRGWKETCFLLFFPTPPRSFIRAIFRAVLVLCSETARKFLLRRLYVG